MRDGPARGGTRGGKDQFSWDAVKGDKDREYYLGHSVKASVGRWQNGKDLLWYTREKDGDGGGVNAEIAAIKVRARNPAIRHRAPYPARARTLPRRGARCPLGDSLGLPRPFTTTTTTTAASSTAHPLARSPFPTPAGCRGASHGRGARSETQDGTRASRRATS